MDEVKYKYDDQFPRSVVNVADFRAILRAIHQMDLAPLRPLAKRILDEMEYSTDGAAQAQYAGTGVTITKQAVSGSLVQEGSFSLKAVTDGTSNRSFERSLALNLSAFSSMFIWERSSQTSDTFQFYLEDSLGNQSRWDITSNGTPDTWQQDEIDLTTPDSDSGTPADLSDIVAYGFRDLTASTTYYFDTIYAVVGMTVAVNGTNLGGYFKNIHIGGEPVLISSKAAPTLSAPVSLPRIDILVLESDGDLVWVEGDEATSPVAPWDDVPANVVPICEVLLKTTMARVVDYDEKDVYTDEGYISSDVRPFISA